MERSGRFEEIVVGETRLDWQRAARFWGSSDLARGGEDSVRRLDFRGARCDVGQCQQIGMLLASGRHAAGSHGRGALWKPESGYLEQWSKRSARRWREIDHAGMDVGLGDGR